MNKRFIKPIAYMTLIIYIVNVLVTNTFTLDVLASDDMNLLENNIIESSEDNEIVNGDFEMVEDTTDDRWQDSISASGWVLQHRIMEPANPPKASFDKSFYHNGTQSIKFQLDKSWGWLEQKVSAQKGDVFDISAWYKTDNLNTTHYLKNVTLLRVEQLDSTGKYIEGTRVDLDILKNGTYDWTKLTGQYTIDQDSTSYLKVLIMYGCWGKGYGASGTLWVDDVKVIKQPTSVEEIVLDETSRKITVNEEIQINHKVMPETASNKKVTMHSTNEEVAVVDENGIVTGVKSGEATIVITSVEDPSIKSECHITVVDGAINVDNIILDRSEVTIQEGRGLILNYSIEPFNAENKNVKWHSSDDSVVTVSEGILMGINEGAANITVTTVDGQHEATCKVEVTDYVTDEFDQLRLKWRKTIIPDYDISNPNIEDKLKEVAKEAKEYWQTMDKNSERTYLWNDLSNGENDGTPMGLSYTRLYKMSLAYAMEGNELYNNKNLLKDIVAGLDWLLINWFNKDESIEGNGWWWTIGANLRLTDIVVILYDHLSTKQVEDYMNVVRYFTDVTDGYAANRVDICRSALVEGLIVKDSNRVIEARDALSIVFPYVTSKEGYYTDGSYVDHITIPYTHSYGAVLISGISKIMYLLGDSSWDFVDPQVNNVFNWIYDSYEPAIYKMQAFDCLRGRAISRENSTDLTTGKGILGSIALIAEAANEKDKEYFRSLIKYMIDENPYYEDIDASIFNITILDKIKNDTNIIPRGELIKHVEFNNMDRSAHFSNDYAFAVSKSSKRIWTYELLNGENQKGWYSGHGMTYLYNKDADAYSDDFWATVNYYRLPGTTIGTQERKTGHYQWGDGEGNPDNSWSGGVTIEGKYGVSGMDLQDKESSLEAKKSWFMFDDEIVALGSNINSSDDTTIETIIEQRKINNMGDNEFIVDGNSESNQLGWSETMTDVKWAHLAGTASSGADIGYYFPENATVKGTRLAQKGKWSDINMNPGVSEEERTKNYLTLWFDHGTNPINKKYSYVVLPNKTPSQMDTYANNPDVTILKNTEKVHCVRENNLNIIAANFWTDTVEQVDIIRVNKKSTIMVKDSDDYLEVVVSDPTMENNENIIVELQERTSEELLKDPNIEILQLSPTVKFSVNVKDAKGKAFTAKFIKDKEIIDEVPVESIVLDKEDITLFENGQQLINALILPENATDKELEWTSSDENIVTVQKGILNDALIKGLKTGNGIITVTSMNNPAIKAKINVEVVEKQVTEENMVKNGSFEEINTDGPISASGYLAKDWYINFRAIDSANKPIASFDNQTYLHGNQSIKLETNKTWGWLEQKIPAKKGDIFNISAWYKANDLNNPKNKPATLRIEQLDSKGGFINNTRIDLGSFNNGTYDWTELKGQYEIDQENAKYLKIVLMFGEWISGSGNGNGATGTLWIDDVKIIKQPDSIQGIELDESERKVSVNDSFQLKYNIIPESANNQVKWQSSNEDIASVENGLVTGKKVGDTVITVVSLEDPMIKDECKVTVVEGDIKVEEVELNKSSIIINKGRGNILKPIIKPYYAANQEVKWISSDSNIAVVEEGKVIGISEGTAIVSAITLDGEYQADCEITVKDYESDIYDNMRQKWKNTLVTNEIQDNEIIKGTISELDENIKTIWDSMNKSSDRNCLWNEYNDGNNPSHISKSYDNLYTMAKGFVMAGSQYYGNVELLKDVTEGLKWLNENWYKIYSSYPGNWWFWEIGIPKHLINTIILTYDYLSDDEINKYMDVINRYVPDPTKFYNQRYTSTGANRVDLCLVVGLRGVLVKDSAKLTLVRDSIGEVVEFVDKYDGFYTDGSFIQHNDIAYTGTYGSVLLGGLADVIYLLDDTSWEVVEEEVQNIYNNITRSFKPLIYKGLMMDMVNGRAISRQGVEDIGHGAGIIRAILKYTRFAPEEYNVQYKSMLKYWMKCSESRLFSFMKNVDLIILANDILNDNKVQPEEEQLGHFGFYNMDRVVHRTPDFTLGLSMYSKKIAAYEIGNGENKKGFHTGDGMTYLYNNDLTQFNEDYWPTVDYKRLPGTTVDTNSIESASDWKKYRSPQAWVGGTNLDGYGVAGMYLDKSNALGSMHSTLQGKKSWFMFDDEVVALGSGINCTDGRTIETIVENRKISDTGDEILTVDGQEVSSTLGWNNNEKTNWAHLQGKVKGSDIGYYFPNKPRINMLREARTGSWNEINVGGSSDVITRNYLTMWFNHGANPQNATYEYVILPNKTKEEVSSYSNKPEIEILANNNKVQSVKEKELNIIAVNFWTDEVNEIDIIKADKKASIIMKEAEDFIEVSISDPTMENEGIINVEIDKQVTEEVLHNERIIVDENSPTIRFSVNVKDAKGKPFTAKFIKKKNSNGNYHNVYDTDEDDKDKENVDEDIHVKNNIITVEVPAYNNNGNVISAISSSKLEKALNLADKNTDEAKIVLEVPSIKDAEGYSIRIPANMIASNNKSNDIELNTSIGDITIPDNMLNNYDIKSQDKAEITISKVDRSSLSKDISEIIGSKPIIDLTVKIGNKKIEWNNINAPVIINLDYEPTKEELNNTENIIIWYIDENDKITPISNSRYNEKTGKVTFTATHFSKYSVAYIKKTFSDINNYQWARKQIETLAARGIVNGTSETTYSPEQNISRADFLTLLVRTLDLKCEFDSNFNDVDKNAYYYNAIGIAKELGITNGRGNNTFEPNQSITRQDMMILIERSLKIFDKPLNYNGGKDIKDLKDSCNVSGYALSSVDNMIKSGLIQGTDDMLYPLKNTTRAETAVIMYKIFYIL
ncbi:polysaccharide lyase family 8 super-sandwich domain-containing protein [Vallitalea guaymasensis]|uniref:polysaccharide lyase family 8 super-sandwich domain-containing protein n=1 Tax=Vallitalea guaymasensis TaxID=1185412 RepID=UPI00187D10C2|nr:polysaccharide lyase family 8 super-sandwich domain-containing protein [Vallitalea guaymasensis]